MSGTKARNLALAAAAVDSAGNVTADLIDGIDSAQFLRKDTDDTISGDLTVTGNLGIGPNSPNASLDLSGRTDSILLPQGTTLQRPSNPPLGSVRYNTDTGLVEQYNATGWQGIDAPPTVTSFSGVINENTSSTITVSGSNFKSGSIVYIEGAGVGGVPRALTTTYVSSVELTADTNASNVNYSGAQSFNVKVTNPSGLASTLEPAGTVDRDPSWSTASGSLGTYYDRSQTISTSVSATDPDGDTITYSVVSGSLPSGVSLNASSGAITGDPGDVASDTTYPFTISANSNTQSEYRSFSFLIKRSIDGSSSDRAAPSARYIKELTSTTTDGFYWIQTPDMTSPQQIFCDMNNEGGGWMLLFMNQGGNVNMTQTGTFYDNLNSSSHTSNLSPRRYNGSSYGAGRTQVWISSKNRTGVKMMKTYNMYNSSHSIVDYDMSDTNTNGINHANSRISRQVYDILDMGSSVSPAHIYSTIHGGSPSSTLANAVTLYVDGGNYGGSGGTYNYGSTNTLYISGDSRGFANYIDPQGQSSSNYMQSWGARHWIAYNNEDGQSRMRCQFVCWGSEPYLLEVGMWMKENTTWQP